MTPLSWEHWAKRFEESFPLPGARAGWEEVADYALELERPARDRRGRDLL